MVSGIAFFLFSASGRNGGTECWNESQELKGGPHCFSCQHLVYDKSLHIMGEPYLTLFLKVDVSFKPDSWHPFCFFPFPEEIIWQCITTIQWVSLPAWSTPLGMINLHTLQRSFVNPLPQARGFGHLFLLFCFSRRNCWTAHYKQLKCGFCFPGQHLESDQSPHI